jgi:OmcA/MtrC family decaheme c-type cytochrome
VKNKKGEPYDLPKFSRLAIVMAGPTADYAQYFTEDPRATATRNGDGSYTYTFNTAIPAGQKGTWSMGLEGYNNFTILPGTTKALTVRDAGVNKVTYFSVDGSPVQKRREVVSLAKCNDCHAFLSLHGGNRNTVEQCVLCHAPNVTDAAVRPAAQMPAESIQMANMIHKIHTGKLIDDEEYTIYGRGGTPHNYNHVGYPGDSRNCNACHINNSQQVPLPKGLLPVKDPRGLIDPLKPTAAACLGCHTSVDAASHALVNTSTIGESCGACHGNNRDKSVNRAHAR